MHFPVREGYRTLFILINSMNADGHIGEFVLNRIVCQGFPAIAAVGGGEDLDVEFSGSSTDQLPHFGHNGVVQAGVDFVDEEGAVFCADK